MSCIPSEKETIVVPQGQIAAEGSNTFNNEIPFEEAMVLVPQNQVEAEGSDTSSDEINIKSPFDTSKIRIEAKPVVLETLIKRIRNDEIDLYPDFQRRSDIWTETVQSRLIESLILRIPIPAFYFDATDNDKWIVVDGLQRLTAIKLFVVDQDLRLTDLEFLSEDCGKKKFDELPRNLQRNIEESDISTYLIKDGTPDEVKFNLFKRINTGGLPLNAQEIRHALNQGQITPVLKSLAESDEFRRVIAGGLSAKRMDDRECVVRFFAFMTTEPTNYDSDDFDLFLNEAMKRANDLPHDELKILSDQFLEAMRRAENLFGNDAFRKRYKEKSGRLPTNKALFESWSVNLAKLTPLDMEVLSERKNDLKKEFIETMKGNREFENAISQGTGSRVKVRVRFKTIAKIIQKVLHAS